MSFYETLFKRNWQNFNWTNVKHHQCWKFFDDLEEVAKELASQVDKVPGNELANRVADINDIERKGMSYCSGVTPRALRSVRVPGTNKWLY